MSRASRRRLRLIVPHIRRAVLIGKVIELKKTEAASLADTLDGIGAGMLLVDATGRIVHANAAGHAMLDRSDVLREASGKLAANDPQADQTLADIFASAGNGDAAIGVVHAQARVGDPQHNPSVAAARAAVWSP